MAPMPPPRGLPEVSADRGERNADAVDCSVCLGVSVYKRAMQQQRQPPECKGIAVTLSASREKMQELRARANRPRPEEDFTLYGLGLSLYSPDWMTAGDRLPVVRGLGLLVVQSDPDELMRRIEQRKRIKRELEGRREAGDEGGDLDDLGDYDGDADDDIIIDLGGDDDPDEEKDGSPLMEKPPIGSGMPTPPRMPPVLPTFTLDELMHKSVEHMKTMTRGMYQFWAKRMDGFGERYEESCRRIVAQMDKQVRAVPQGAMWLQRKAKEIEEQVRRGGGSGGGAAGGV